MAMMSRLFCEIYSLGVSLEEYVGCHNILSARVERHLFSTAINEKVASVFCRHFKCCCCCNILQISGIFLLCRLVTPSSYVSA